MKKLIIGIVVLAVIGLGWWMLSSKNTTPSPTDTATSTTSNANGDQASADISAQLQGLNETDLNAEFKDIDNSSQGL